MSIKKSWLSIAPTSDFSLENVPFGVARTAHTPPRVVSRLGNHIIDLAAMHQRDLFSGISLPTNIFTRPNLNAFISLDKSVSRAVRKRIITLFSVGEEAISGNTSLQKEMLGKASSYQSLMPIAVRDYTDFYSSLEHASNVGAIFRDPKNPLLPNWRHLPVGYHGRASSIVPSGTPIRRPWGQIKAPTAHAPSYAPSRQMDFELELAFVTCKDSALGEPIPIACTEDYIFGFLLFNDWSARDIQAWEYVPLGPFLGKNFGSSVSPWVVTLDALTPFKITAPVQDPAVLPYLQHEPRSNFDIMLSVFLSAAGSEEQLIVQSNAKYLYWTAAQQLAHHTVNGCNVGVGDMYASGTISGPTEESYGSMLERTWRGQRPLHLSGGNTRKFLADGDSVIMRGQAKNDTCCVGFGEVEGTIMPARDEHDRA